MKPSEAVGRHGESIRRVESHRRRNPQVFDSVGRVESAEQSDLDLLFEPTRGATLFDIGAIQVDLQILLGVRMEVLTPRVLPEMSRRGVIPRAEAVHPELLLPLHGEGVTNSRRRRSRRIG
jgi:uncharacterized protein